MELTKETMAAALVQLEQISKMKELSAEQRDAILLSAFALSFIEMHQIHNRFKKMMETTELTAAQKAHLQRMGIEDTLGMFDPRIEEH